MKSAVLRGCQNGMAVRMGNLRGVRFGDAQKSSGGDSASDDQVTRRGFAGDVFLSRDDISVRTKAGRRSIMTVQFAGSRSMDERRRRRLVLNGDAEPVVLSLAGAHERSVVGETERPIPGIPRRAWVFWLLVGTAYLVAICAICLRFYGPTIPAELDPLVHRLWRGGSPGLLRWWQVFSWTVVAWLSCAIGWCRAQSQLDFDGRFHIWPRAAGFAMLMIFCSVTDIHDGLAECVVKMTRGELWRPEVSCWLFPLLLISLPITLLVDRDLRRNRAGVILFRLASLLLFASLGGLLWLPELQRPVPHAREIVHGMQLLGNLTMLLAAWCHLRFVIFECCDPPLPTKMLNESRWLGWVTRISVPSLFRRTQATEPEPKRRRSAKVAIAEEGDNEEEAPKKPRKKATPAKPKRASKPRVRVQVAEEDEEAQDESVTDSSGEESGEDANSGWSEEESNSLADDAQESANITEEEGWSVPHAKSRGGVPAPHHTSKSRAETSSESYPSSDDEDDQGSDYGGDDSQRSHTGTADSDAEGNDGDDDEGGDGSDGMPTRDQLKGLSKRQKRELRRQMKQQQKR